MGMRHRQERGQSQEEWLQGHCFHSDEKTLVRQRKEQAKTTGRDPELVAKDLALVG